MHDPVDLAFRSYGDGEPLLILHGLFGSARNWQSIAQTLGERWRVLVADLRNHGASPWRADASYYALAADLHRFLARHAPAGAPVLGHSMGGKAAMTLALLHPQQVRALAVLDMAPVGYDHGRGHREYIAAMRALDLAAMERRGEADAALAASVPDAGVRRFLLQNLVTQEGAMTWRINLDALEDQMDEITGFPNELLERQYPGPCLFLHGGASDYLRPEHRTIIERLFPAAEITAVAGAGHWLHAEQPELIVRMLVEFFTR